MRLPIPKRGQVALLRKSNLTPFPPVDLSAAFRNHTATAGLATAGRKQRVTVAL